MKAAVLFASILLATAARADVVISECNIYPDYNAASLGHQNLGESVYGYWYYDLVYRHNETVQLTDPYGQPECGQPVTRSTVQTQHFQISDGDGTAQDIEQEVKTFLAAHQVDRCTSRPSR